MSTHKCIHPFANINKDLVPGELVWVPNSIRWYHTIHKETLDETWAASHKHASMPRESLCVFISQQECFYDRGKAFLLQVLHLEHGPLIAVITNT